MNFKKILYLQAFLLGLSIVLADPNMTIESQLYDNNGNLLIGTYDINVTITNSSGNIVGLYPFTNTVLDSSSRFFQYLNTSYDFHDDTSISYQIKGYPATSQTSIGTVPYCINAKYLNGHSWSDVAVLVSGMTVNGTDISPRGVYNLSTVQGTNLIVSTLVSVISNGSDIVNQTGLRAFYHMNNSFGNITDSSAFGNAAVPKGASVYNQSGAVNYSILFNSTGYFNLSDKYIPNGSAARSFNLWVKSNGSCHAGEYDIIFGYGTNSGTQMLFLGTDTTYGYTTELIVTQNGGGVDTTGANICDGNWKMITVTYDGGTAWKIYLNGAYNNGGSMTTNTKSTGYMQIGAFPLVASWKNWIGNIDEFAVWNRTLGATEISNIYTNQSQVYVYSNLPSSQIGINFTANQIIFGNNLTMTSTLVSNATYCINSSRAATSDSTDTFGGLTSASYCKSDTSNCPAYLFDTPYYHPISFGDWSITYDGYPGAYGDGDTFCDVDNYDRNIYSARGWYSMGPNTC